MVRNARPRDAGRIATIYNHYISQTIVTFEESPIESAEMAARIDDVLAAGLPFLVVESGGEVVGYAHASKWKGRCAYRFSVEVSAYLHHDVVGRGFGSTLYQELCPRLADNGFHALIGGIALPNDASIRLHEKFGFEQVARFPEVGFKFGRWIDVGYWQCVLA
jgi:L-amino acid N-acyltransferase YncA